MTQVGSAFQIGRTFNKDSRSPKSQSHFDPVIRCEGGDPEVYASLDAREETKVLAGQIVDLS